MEFQSLGAIVIHLLVWDFPGGPAVEICLPLQGTRVQPLVWEIPHASG